MSRLSLANLPFRPVLGAALIALVGLAALQYSWVDQVSAGERERRRAGLEVAARRLGEDFDHEIARAYLSFQMDAETLRRRDWQRYSQRYERWMQTAPYPGLVKRIYLVEVNQIGRVVLSQYSPAARRFEAARWPGEFQPLRQRIERAYRQIFSEDAAAIELLAVDADAPSLVVPVSRPWLLSDQRDPGIDADLLFSELILPGSLQRCLQCSADQLSTPLLAHTLVILDEAYLAETMLPSLARRYFLDGGLSYNIGVVEAAQPERLVFSVGDGRGDFSSGDAAVPILNVTYENLNALMLSSDPRFDLSAEPTAGQERIAIGVLGRPASSDEAAGGWLMVLRHRDGSLDAAIEGLRTRNLLVSFGTTLLLGASVAVLLLSARRAQRLARQQIEFASAVSHELRTPLAVIRSAGENLADGVIHDPQQARQYGALISNEGRRLTEMIEQVLAFAGAQSGQSRYIMATADVAQIIEGAIHAVQHQLRDSGFTLEQTLASDLPTITADAGALKRSIQNILSNAVKYSGPSRWIGIDAAVVALDGSSELQIRVRDRGLGIEPGDLRRIFEPFYRGQSSVAAHAPGSGLGLSLVRHAVEAHGGRVSVESRVGEGSLFTLHLPLPPADSRSFSPARALAGE